MARWWLGSRAGVGCQAGSEVGVGWCRELHFQRICGGLQNGKSSSCGAVDCQTANQVWGRKLMGCDATGFAPGRGAATPYP